MTSQIKEEKQRIGGKGRGASLFVSAFISLLFSLLIGGASLFVAAFIFSLRPEQSLYISTVGCVLGAVTACLGGFLAGKRQRHAGALVGVVFGIIFTALLALIGEACGGDGNGARRVIGYAVFLLLSVLGGALATVEPKRKRHGKRRH